MIRSITVDTLTAIQQNSYMEDKRKPGHDEWKDYGGAIYTFVNDIMERGFEIIMILGEPGTGKSSGMRTLPHDSNIWFNTDNKNPVWEGGRAEYGKKSAPRFPFHVIPTKYKEIVDMVDKGLKKNNFEQDRFAFILGHTETYKKGNQNLERLKTLGKVATKMQIEGKMESVLYSRVRIESGKPEFILETQNDGFNTARSPQNLLEGIIPNDYGMIIDKLLTF